MDQSNFIVGLSRSISDVLITRGNMSPNRRKTRNKRKVFTPPKDLSASGGLSALTIQAPEF